MTRRTLSTTILILASVTLAACADSDTDGPPDIRYGVSVCDQCNMIISDERFATASITHDERDRRKPLLFDDINCQFNYEREHDPSPILARWVHDHDTRDWIDAADAAYVHAMKLHTPMASHVAAFANEADARALADELGGTILGFDELEPLWDHDASHGHDHEHPDPQESKP